MYVRLAFAVAAHLESEILIVDEVLAVGDAEFQKKCIGKMGEVSKGEGRTILFVSHNMDSVRGLCNKGMVLNHGSILFNGEVNEAISSYLYHAKNDEVIRVSANVTLSNDVMLELFEIDKASVVSHEDLAFNLRIRSSHINHFSSVALNVYDDAEQKIAFFDLRCSELYETSDISEVIEIHGRLKNLPLLPGFYNIALHIQSNLLYKDFMNLLRFEVVQKTLVDDNLPYPLFVRGKAEIDYDFKIV
jgi:lipopolysaccharide transport system ATP-binding protein